MASKDVFKFLHSQKYKSLKLSVSCSFFEIYSGKVKTKNILETFLKTSAKIEFIVCSIFNNFKILKDNKYLALVVSDQVVIVSNLFLDETQGLHFPSPIPTKQFLSVNIQAFDPVRIVVILKYGGRGQVLRSRGRGL